MVNKSETKYMILGFVKKRWRSEFWRYETRDVRVDGGDWVYDLSDVLRRLKIINLKDSFAKFACLVSYHGGGEERGGTSCEAS
jgi:hypothetical protein